MTVAPTKTPAETALAEQFEAIRPRLPGSAAAGAARAAAMSQFKQSGLPHRRIEAWKYTDLRAALAVAAPPVAGPASLTLSELDAALGELASLEADRFVFVDGVFAAGLSSRPAAGASEFQPLSDALATAADDRASELLGTRAEQPAMTALASAFASDGVVLAIPARAGPVRPALIVHVAKTPGAAAVSIRHHVTIAKGARACLIEVFVSIAGRDAGHQVRTASTVTLGEGAVVSHVKATLGCQDLHVASRSVELARAASYRGFQFIESPRLSRDDIAVTFTGPDASLDLSGAFLATGGEHVDTTLVVDHAAPSCQSRELFKGVLAGRARGVFQGKIIVRQAAQKTDGKQMSKALMLSEDAEFDSKPELEIFADDVVCGHGATVADIDSDHMFYLQARGIPPVEARALLVQAFVSEALDRIEHDGLREALAVRASAWLARLEP